MRNATNTYCKLSKQYDELHSVCYKNINLQRLISNSFLFSKIMDVSFTASADNLKQIVTSVHI